MKPEAVHLKDKVSSIPDKPLNKNKPEIGKPTTKYDKAVETDEGTIENVPEEQAP